MKPFTLYIVLFLTFFSSLYAYDLSNYDLSDKEDTNVTCTVKTTMPMYIEKPKKGSKKLYQKFENLFSDYDGNLLENMFTYAADIVIPDENILATKEIINNRIDRGFDSEAKVLLNDFYSIFLTTAYYQMQDISRITEELWEEEVCDPDTFEYNTSKEPKEPILTLQECDENARGVTKNGIVLPVNPNFPDAFYPYAAKPDGCSAEGLQDVYDDANKFSDDDEWLREACNTHDRCYFTLGTSSKECNAQFIIDAVDSCNNISNKNTLLFMGTKNAFCGVKGLLVSTAANSCAHKYFAEAQREQKAYHQWIIRYEKAYTKAKQSQ